MSGFTVELELTTQQEEDLQRLIEQNSILKNVVTIQKISQSNTKSIKVINGKSTVFVRKNLAGNYNYFTKQVNKYKEVAPVKPAKIDKKQTLTKTNMNMIKRLNKIKKNNK